MISEMSAEKKKDIVHSLSQSDRLLYLMHGYIQPIQNIIKPIIPNAIKNLCGEFAKFRIKSETDKEIERTTKPVSINHIKYISYTVYIIFDIFNRQKLLYIAKFLKVTLD